jgi:large subunit ribosomal protein L23
MAKKEDNAKKSEQPVINDTAFTYSVLVEPYVTEKSYGQIADNKYSFVVTKDANKFAIAKAIEKTYNVKVDKVNIIRTKSEEIFVRGKKATTATFKKAIVTLQDGYSLNI